MHNKLTQILELWQDVTNLTTKRHLRMAAWSEFKCILNAKPVVATQPTVYNHNSPWLNFPVVASIGNLNQEEVRLGVLRGKIAAIKAYRQRTGLSLCDAKESVEQFFYNHDLTFPSY